jgi:poly-beta-1,6-N-acetyl-D-glucosamine synthase
MTTTLSTANLSHAQATFVIPMKVKYVIISAVRGEEQYIGSTLESVVSQSVPPAEWIIVDDGSSDRTAATVQSFAERNPWIRLVQRTNRGFRKSGAGVVEAFYDGFNSLRGNDWDFVVKLDGDLSFAPNYFASLFSKFQANPSLGIAGADLFHQVEGQLQVEKCPRFHVRGATKIYRKECWAAIGGLIAEPGWDIVDETKANMLGWTTESFADIQAIHHRFTGTAESKWKDQVKNGRAYYVAGYHPLFMAAKCMYRLASKPYVTGSLGMAYGFLLGYLNRSSRVEDRALVQYVRRQQIRRLCGRETIWK